MNVKFVMQAFLLCQLCLFYAMFIMNMSRESDIKIAVD